MGSKPLRESISSSTTRRSRRRVAISQKRLCSGQIQNSPRSIDGSPNFSSVSDKLEALQKLIPVANNGDIIKADQLFKQTADYILLLRTQVSFLQGLVDLYDGSTETHT